ncbi:MAG: hypothetical protein DDT20_00676 [Firmicutes bacterium]|nr:hypothetical protein [Bacillota bacterium]
MANPFLDFVLGSIKPGPRVAGLDHERLNPNPEVRRMMQEERIASERRINLQAVDAERRIGVDPRRAPTGFGAALPPTPSVPVPPVTGAIPPVPPATAGARMAAELPTLSRAFGGAARGLGIAARVAVPALGAVAPAAALTYEGVGIGETFADPRASEIEKRLSVIDAGTRMAGMAAGAKLGFVGMGPKGAAVGGIAGLAVPAFTIGARDAFMSPQGESILTPEFAKTVSAAGGTEKFIKGLGAVAPVVTQVPTALGSEDATQNVRELGLVASRAEPAAPTPAVEERYLAVHPSRVGGIGGAIEGLMNMRYNIGVDTKKQVAVKRSNEQQKLILDELIKMPAARVKVAQLDLARTILDPRTSEADRARAQAAAAALEGRIGAQPRAFQVPPGIQPSVLDVKNPIANVLDTVSGEVQATAIRPVAPQAMTYAEVVAQARAAGKTVEQGLAEAKRKNVTVTGVPAK